MPSSALLSGERLPLLHPPLPHHPRAHQKLLSASSLPDLSHLEQKSSLVGNGMTSTSFTHFLLFIQHPPLQRALWLTPTGKRIYQKDRRKNWDGDMNDCWDVFGACLLDVGARLVVLVGRGKIKDREAAHWSK